MKKDVAVEKFNRFVKSKNLRSTSQRSLIVDEFLNMGEHISSEELYDRLKKMDPTIGQATVYRTLK
ncbi:MAG: transcriptional repressor, partial [Calditrichales bacterium]